MQKLSLPKELQREMIKFFLKTSVPRMKREQVELSSENKTDGCQREYLCGHRKMQRLRFQLNFHAKYLQRHCVPNLRAIPKHRCKKMFPTLHPIQPAPITGA